ncbi:NAD(P)H-dependent oxidoreductase [Streptomyces sp. NPDC049577]|uniref:NADPH-dependent FMN reductase n=1 Tax=Streptomyces sp. NPDC049577 TaxID=3155153 RepID=UPI00344470E9
MIKLVLISGSLRRGSLNSAALRAVRRIIEDMPVDVEVVSLPIGRIPFYDGDVEEAGMTAAVEAARALVADADALVISTPSYNGAVSGVLKNALDWLSRPYGASPLTDKAVAVLSASPGGRGAVDAQPALLTVLRTCGAFVVEHPPVAIGQADQRLDRHGEMTDPEILDALRGLVGATLTAATRPARGGGRRSPLSERLRTVSV